MEKDNSLINIKDLATMFNVSVSTVHGWMHKNVMPVPYYRIGERAIRFKKSEILAYLESAKI